MDNEVVKLRDVCRRQISIAELLPRPFRIGVDVPVVFVFEKIALVAVEIRVDNSVLALGNRVVPGNVHEVPVAVKVYHIPCVLGHAFLVVHLGVERDALYPKHIHKQLKAGGISGADAPMLYKKAVRVVGVGLHLADSAELLLVIVAGLHHPVVYGKLLFRR